MKNKTNCPLWQNFLDEILPEKEKQEMLRIFIEAIPTRSIEQMLVLLGSGSNGKSVVMGVIAMLFETEVSKVELSELTGKKLDYALAEIDGKKINLSHGLDKINPTWLKPILAGERLICRRPYGKPHFTTSIPMFICETNNIPDNLSIGIMRRLEVIKFDVEIMKQDHSLTEKLFREKDGIMEWAGIR